MERVDEIISYICNWLMCHSDSVEAPEIAKALAELVSAKAKRNMALRSCQGKKTSRQQAE